mgnify:CR=1 FL=1
MSFFTMLLKATYNEKRMTKGGKKMGTRPSLYQLIGVQKSELSNFEEWKETVYTQYAEINYMAFTEELYEQTYPVEVLRKRQTEPLKDLLIHQCIKLPEDERITVFGMLPATKLKQSELYAKELVYTMIEAGMLPEHPHVTKLPYRDVRSLIGKTEMEIAEATDYELVSKEEVEDVQRYNGVWARKYPNQTLQHFDRDLEFAYQLFTKLGIPVSRQAIDRYLIVDYA